MIRHLRIEARNHDRVEKLLVDKSCRLCIRCQRSIKTDGNTKKGKVSVVRKRIFADELKPTEHLEIKVAADVIKRFNWENQHLFGDLISAVKKTCASIAIKKPSKKGTLRKSGECFNHNPIPVKDVIEAPFKDIDVSSILEFPMTDHGDEQPLEEDIRKLNMTRQYLEHLNGSQNMPSVSTILEKTMPSERRSILEKWKAKMIEEMGEDKFKQYQQGWQRSHK